MLCKWIIMVLIFIIPFAAYADINHDLFEATRKGETSKVELLLQAGANVTALEGGTALTLAAYLGHTEIVHLLIGAGSYIDASDQWPATALIYAAYLGNVEIAQALLVAGADVNLDVESPLGTALAAAVSGRHTEMVKLLLDAGSKIKTRERQSGKEVDAAELIRTAEENGDSEIVEMLNKTLEKELISELVDASYMGDFEVVRILVKMGADVNAKDSYGRTAIESAAMSGNNGLYEFLIANGGNSNLFISASATDEQRVKELISNGSDVNAVNEYGSTALMLASKDTGLEVMEILLLNGAVIDYQDRQGRTALMMAAKNGWKEAVAFLLNHDADIHIKDNNNKTASEFAEWHKNINLMVGREIIELLMESGSTIKAVANDSGVRIRNNPTTSNSRTIGSVDRGDEVIILGKSEKEEKIQNMMAHWYKIKTEDRTIGYAYGYFFDINTVEIEDIPTF